MLRRVQRVVARRRGARCRLRCGVSERAGIAAEARQAGIYRRGEEERATVRQEGVAR